MGKQILDIVAIIFFINYIISLIKNANLSLKKKEKWKLPAFAFRSSGVTITTKRIARSLRNISYAHLRTDLMHFTAAIPLLAIKTYTIKKLQFIQCG